MGKRYGNCDRILEYHNCKSELHHEMIRNYVPGSGCDICSLPDHEASKDHHKVASRHRAIQKKFMALRKKSARK